MPIVVPGPGGPVPPHPCRAPQDDPVLASVQTHPESERVVWGHTAPFLHEGTEGLETRSFGHGSCSPKVHKSQKRHEGAERKRAEAAARRIDHLGAISRDEGEQATKGDKCEVVGA